MNRVICVDFDGTCVEHRYPEIGDEVEGCIRVLKRLQECGDKIILWTMRSDGGKDGDTLTQAKEWLESRGITLFGVNENPTQARWTGSPKAYGHIYIDDAALGCPVKRSRHAKGRPVVDWKSVEKILFGEETSPQPADTFITTARFACIHAV